MPVNDTLAQGQWDRYTYVRDNGHLRFLEKARKCENFFAGLQWEDKVRKKLECQGRPVMTINLTLATINAIMGEQLQNRADVTFRPFRNGNEETSTALAKTWLQIANANGLHDLETDMFDDGIITSRGFIDMRIAFDDHMMGEVRLKHVSSRNIGIDPDAESYDPDDWKDVFVTKWLTPDEIAIDYNAKDAKQLELRDESVWGHDSISSDEDTKVVGFGGYDDRASTGERKADRKRIRVLERQFRKRERLPHFVDTQTGDMRVVPESWPAERVSNVMQKFGWQIIQKETERVHWRVTADNVILHDAPSPYKHFTVVPYFPFFRKGNAMGMAEQFIDLNEILNKASSQELHIINSSANGGWKYKTGSLKNMDVDEFEERGAETGLVLELDNVDDAQKIAPNPMPTGLDRVTFKTNEWIKQVSGVSDSSRGFDREDVAAKAIQAKQAAGSVNLAKPFENLVRTRRLLARNGSDLIQGYYTERRMLQITGNMPGDKSEEVAVNDVNPMTGEVINDLTAGEYTVVVSSVPLRESYMESQFEEAVRLKELGVQLPDDILIGTSTLDNKAEVLEAMNDSGAQELQQREQEASIRRLELENQKLEIDVERNRQEADLANARAEKTRVDAAKIGSEIGQGEPGGAQNQVLEQAKAEDEAELERRKMDLDHKLDQAKLELDRQIAEEKMDLERDMQNQRLALEQAKAEDQAELEAAKAQAQARQQARITDIKAAVARNQVRVAEKQEAQKPASAQTKKEVTA